MPLPLPRDADVAYNEEAGEYQVMPSVAGNTLGCEAVLDAVAQGVAEFSAAVEFGPEHVVATRGAGERRGASCHCR